MASHRWRTRYQIHYRLLADLDRLRSVGPAGDLASAPRRSPVVACELMCRMTICDVAGCFALVL